MFLIRDVWTVLKKVNNIKPNKKINYCTLYFVIILYCVNIFNPCKYVYVL